MAAPVVTATLNKSSYAPGESIILTVNHTDPDRQVLNISITVTDSTGATGTATASAVIDGAVTVTPTSTPSRVWTPQSVSANQSVFTTTA